MKSRGGLSSAVGWILVLCHKGRHAPGERMRTRAVRRVVAWRGKTAFFAEKAAAASSNHQRKNQLPPGRCIQASS